ncbi:hypothetical protein [Streptomyces sp. NBC_00078]|uniref:hypothetical protein n=1 Tax=unclassified Streptomyces TaxID=2593676 RepID=UPI002250CB99|nr:hypothetical protein [Streptomyces sp. NBC_00078]MCX5418250.1 hypothetical protein [Streptomyces sp. NBC_00078]
MNRILGIELRRSASLGAALVIAIAGTIVLQATAGRWSSGWMALVMTQREYLAVLSPLAMAAGAWQSYREHRANVAELFAGTPRPRPQRIVPILVTTGLTVLVAYLVTLLAATPLIAGTARYLPAAAFAVVAVGLIAMIASVWLGLAVGRLVPALATAPALAVIGFVLLILAPHALPDGGVTTAFSPAMGMSMFSDYDTVDGQVSVAQALWMVAVAVAGVVLLAVQSHRFAFAALVPLAIGATATVLVVPTGDAYDQGTLDPVAQELVCTDDAPRVCVSRAHEGLLSEVAPRARHALELLSGTSLVGTRGHHHVLSSSLTEAAGGHRADEDHGRQARPPRPPGSARTDDAHRSVHRPSRLRRVLELPRRHRCRLLAARPGADRRSRCPRIRGPAGRQALEGSEDTATGGGRRPGDRRPPGRPEVPGHHQPPDQERPMRGLTLYARSRQVPATLGAAAAGTATAWLTATVFSDRGEVSSTVLVLTVLLLVAVVTTTLGGPDDSLDTTAARPWAWLRMAHLATALGCVLLLLLATLATGTRFGPFGFVVRDAAGLLGLTALGAATVGTARSWFLPLGWTLGAATFPGVGTAGEALAWQTQAPHSRPAALVATVLAAAGIAAYVSRGPRPRTSFENA